MEAKKIKDLFLNQYKEWEKVGVFRKREMKEGNLSLELINALAQRWRQRPDSEGKRTVSKILSMYDKHHPLLEVVLKDDPFLFEQQYLEYQEKHSRLYWLEIACLCGQEKLVDHLMNSNEIKIQQSTNLLAYGLSVGNITFAYRLAHTLKNKGYHSPECLSLYNKCPEKDLVIIQSFFQEKPSQKVSFLHQ